eukprot:TRINITY_DN91210_c0_g1_i1.p1 TRINITY_DN91210_c0_g1~~TRINITY_DN91210_c0_g1_i1.p1  ORF type:complete len:226 (-),score=35.07 TRINITY_DN91210_c0_g1_i1:135-812(-)
MDEQPTNLHFSEETLSEYSEAFALKSNADGCLAIEHLGMVLRALGQNVSESELQNWIEIAGCKGLMRFPEFLKVVDLINSPGPSRVLTCQHVEGSIVCSDLAGNEIGVFAIPGDADPFGSWLSEQVLTVASDVRMRIQLVDSAGAVLWEQPTKEEQETIDALKVLDRNGSGMVAIDEVRHLLDQPWGMRRTDGDKLEQTIRGLAHLDNGDGQVAVEALAKYLINL